MKWIIGCLVCFTSVLAHADNIDIKARKLFEIQGVVSSFQASIDEGRAQAKVQTKQMLDQMLSQLNPNKEFRARINLAADKFLRSLQTARTAEDIVNVLIKYYAPNFTEAELDKLIEFYSSDIGLKEAAVSKDAIQKAADHYKDENERIRTAATNEYVRELQLIARQCNCALSSYDSTGG